MSLLSRIFGLPSETEKLLIDNPSMVGSLSLFGKKEKKWVESFAVLQDGVLYFALTNEQNFPQKQVFLKGAKLNPMGLYIQKVEN